GVLQHTIQSAAYHYPLRHRAGTLIMTGHPMKSLQGQLLIASPKLFDPNFFRSVVLLVQHTENGALGLILNHPLEMTIANAWEQVSEMPCEATGVLHQGGPCDGPLMVLHTEASNQ